MTLGFGVLGCGRMGRRRAWTVATNPAAHLVAVADIDGARAFTLAAQHGCEMIDRPADLLADDRIDTVFVCTPNKFHAPFAITAVQNGKHVICEKPLARTPQEARSIVKESREHGVTVKVGANLRFFQNVRMARELVDSDSIGDLLFLRASIGNDGWARNGWFADPELSGGGTVLDNGCHMFDLIRWFFPEVESCVGQVMNLHWNLEVEDNGVGIFTTVDGRMASVHASWTEWNEYFSFDIYGRKGFVRVENQLATDRTVLALRESKPEVYDFGSCRTDAYALELSAYLQSRFRGETPEPSGEDGLRAVEMAYAVYESSRSGQKVWLNHRSG